MKLTILASIALLTLAAGCDGESTGTNPLTQLPPLLPDTGSLGAVYVEGATLIAVVDDSVLKDSTLLVALRHRRGTEHPAPAVRVARVEPIADSLFDVGRVIVLQVSPTRRLAFRGRVKSVSPSGSVSWTGDLVGGPTGRIQISHTRNGSIYGTLSIASPLRDEYHFDFFSSSFGFVTRTDYRFPIID